jgi:integrase
MLMRKISKRKPNLIEEKLHLRNRILEPDEWAAMLHTLENLPEDEPHQKDEKERLRAIVCFLYLLGLRVGDLVTHTWQAFQKINGKWWFVAKGKGDKVGTIPVNQELFGIVKRYRSHLGLPEEPLGEALPLILSWRKETPLTARHINRLLKNLAYETSKHLDNPDKKEKLQHFSAHWLRHLSATMQDRAGMRFEHIKANHRHENDQTTRKYIHALDDERHQDMEKLSLKIIV